MAGRPPELAEQLRRTRRIDLRDAVTVARAEPAVGDATLAAQAWLS